MNHLFSVSRVDRMEYYWLVNKVALRSNFRYRFCSISYYYISGIPISISTSGLLPLLALPANQLAIGIYGKEKGNINRFFNY